MSARQARAAKRRKIEDARLFVATMSKLAADARAADEAMSKVRDAFHGLVTAFASHWVRVFTAIAGEGMPREKAVTLRDGKAFLSTATL